MIGRVLDGKYLIQERIGGGGMGSVYRAVHVSLGAPRAIKVMRRDLAEDGNFVERFQNEARLAEGLRHPHLVTLHDFARLPDGSWFIVSELVEGDSIAALLRRGVKFASSDLASLLGQLCDGLAVAHRKGIIHRDISPDNIMIARNSDAEPIAKLLDFGIAKDMAGDTGLHTGSGLLLGKVGYSSPEQMGLLPRGEAIDARTDVFSMAAVAYEMLVGSLPWRKDSVQSYVHDLIVCPEAGLQNVVRRDAPALWRASLLRALARQREERTPTIQALKADMSEAARRTAESELGLPRTQTFVQALSPREATWRKGIPPIRARPRPRARWALGLFLAAAVAAVGLLLARGLPSGSNEAATALPQGRLSVATTLLLRAPTPLPPASLAAATAAPAGVEPTPTPGAPMAPPLRPLDAPAARGLVRDRPIPTATTPTRPRAGSVPAISVPTAAAPPPGTLILRSNPEAMVSLDGEPKGRTPLTLADVAPGRHTLLLVAEDDRRLQESLEIAPGQTLEREVTLPELGSLSVTADAWVELTVDGGPTRQTPCRIERLPAGPHVVRAFRAGYKDRIYPIEVREGETYRLNVALDKQ